MNARPMRAEDRRFIVPTWVRSFAEYAPWGQAATLAAHWHVVDAVLDSAETRGVVLATGEGERVVHAWAVGGASAMHYVYVPPELRGKGFARRVITALFGDYPKQISITHPWPRASRRFRWNPYALPCAALEKAA